MISKAVHRMSTHNVFYVTRDTGWACILGSPIQGKSVVDSAKGTVTVAVDADVVVGAQQQHQPICCGFCHHDANQQERRNIGEERAWSTMPDAEAPSVAWHSNDGSDGRRLDAHRAAVRWKYTIELRKIRLVLQ